MIKKWQKEQKSKKIIRKTNKKARKYKQYQISINDTVFILKVL